MGSVPFAFSVHHFINSVGADAGFAAIIGLAVLALLYFAQARETSSLRDEAHESAQRVQQLEARLAQLMRAQPAAQGGTSSQGASGATGSAGSTGAHGSSGTSGSTGGATSGGSPAPPPPGVPATAAARAQGTEAPPASRSVQAGAAAEADVVPSAAAAGAGTPSPSASGPSGEASGSPTAPAGVGAPALTAATRLIPPSDRQAQGAGQEGAGAEDDPGDAAARPAPRTAAGLQSPELTGFASAPATAAGTAAAAETASDTNGAPPEPVAAPPRPQTQAPTRPVRAGAPYGVRPRSASLRPLPSDSEPPSRLRRVLPVLLGLIALAAVVAVLLAVTSGGTSSKQSNSRNAATNAPSAKHRTKHAAAKPSAFTVAVLNGTATSGLAHRVAVKLGSSGFKQGTVATATDQTRTATVVAFMPSHRKDALGIASTLKLGPASVQPVDANTQAVACPPPAACQVGVVVTVGSDLSNTA